MSSLRIMHVTSSAWWRKVAKSGKAIQEDISIGKKLIFYGAPLNQVGL